ncbi:MAG: DNA mismatch repair endonuclease MutL [Bacillota bacterium]|nr:DNA mismatch repair endonuclease MutL [Bacillota bacterium]
MSIRRLPRAVTERIAAGEVVERPASVVKELVENALDAGARRVRVELEDGGRGAIRVVDDGSGIAAEELPLAVERYATSKLERFEDLERLRTLGFRGEALASIAAVARLEIHSRTPEAEVGCRLRIDPDHPAELEPLAMAPGTRVDVRQLFRNVPARRAHLRSARAELQACEEVVASHALAHPEVAFELVHGGRMILATPGDGRLRHAVAAIWGEEVAAPLLEVRAEEATPAPLRISGLVGPAGLGRGSRALERLAVNGRPVENVALRMAAEEAYRNLLPLHRYPILFLSLELPAAEVDVNVHPTKRVVRFLHERAVQGSVYAAVRRALAPTQAGGAPTAWAGAGRVRDRGVAAGDGWRQIYAPADGAPPAATDLEPGGRPEAGVASGGAGPAGEAAPAASRPLPRLRPLAQIHATYLVCLEETGGRQRLWLVDQHAADERYWFEQLEGRAPGEGVQPLLAPLPVPVDRRRREAWEERRPLLEALGFRAEEGGPSSLWLRAIPAGLRSPEGLFADLLDDEAPGGAWEERLRAWRARVACHAAVRAGDPLEPPAREALLERWASCRAPWTCPHGRPTALEIDQAELARRFLRR